MSSSGKNPSAPAIRIYIFEIGKELTVRKFIIPQSIQNYKSLFIELILISEKIKV